MHVQHSHTTAKLTPSTHCRTVRFARARTPYRLTTVRVQASSERDTEETRACPTWRKAGAVLLSGILAVNVGLGVPVSLPVVDQNGAVAAEEDYMSAYEKRQVAAQKRKELLRAAREKALQMASGSESPEEAKPDTSVEDSNAERRSQLDLLRESVKASAQKYEEATSGSPGLPRETDQTSPAFSFGLPKIEVPPIPKLGGGDEESSSQEEDKGGVSLPSFSAPSIPKLEAPKLSMPPMPKLGGGDEESSSKEENKGGVSLPSFSAPSIPKFEAPKFEAPKLSMPPMPKLGGGDEGATSEEDKGGVSLPSFSAPSIPKFEAPKLDIPQTPSIPKFQAPKLNVPPMPKVDVPPMPPMPKFGMPSIPSIPKPAEEAPKVEVKPPVAPKVAPTPTPPPAPKPQEKEEEEDEQDVMGMIRKYSTEQPSTVKPSAPPLAPAPRPAPPPPPAPKPFVPPPPPPPPPVVAPKSAAPVLPPKPVAKPPPKVEQVKKVEKKKGGAPMWTVQILILLAYAGVIASFTVFYEQVGKFLKAAYEWVNKSLENV